ncbi:hypothetical protein BDV12DRAFT_99086 [Aspergillus spectabilis]
MSLSKGPLEPKRSPNCDPMARSAKSTRRSNSTRSNGESSDERTRRHERQISSAWDYIRRSKQTIQPEADRRYKREPKDDEVHSSFRDYIRCSKEALGGDDFPDKLEPTYEEGYRVKRQYTRRHKKPLADDDFPKKLDSENHKEHRSTRRRHKKPLGDNDLSNHEPRHVQERRSLGDHFRL